MATQAPTAPPIRGRSQQTIRRGGLRWQTLFVIVMLCLWEGVPSALTGAPGPFGYQLFAIVIFACCPLYALRAITGRASFGLWDVGALVLFAWCFIVSLYYSAVIAPQPLSAWLFAVYTVTPILFIFALKGVDARISDVTSAIYWSAFVTSLILMANNLLELHLLDYYVRGSGFGTVNRAVFFKLEATFALTMAIVRLAYARSFLNVVTTLVVVVVLFYNVVIASESRLAIVATFVAMLLAWFFIFRGTRKLALLIISPFIVLPAMIYVSERYMRGNYDLSSYLAQDTSASFRALEISNFRQFFDRTGGLGFGFMSGDPKYDNVISYSTNRAGYSYGTGAYGMGLDDIGLYSALYQFGYVGLILILGMTVVAAWALIGAARRGPDYRMVAACGCVMAGFMVSPIGFNHFTLFYSAHIGGLMWFMASRVSAGRAARPRAPIRLEVAA